MRVACFIIMVCLATPWAAAGVVPAAFTVRVLELKRLAAADFCDARGAWTRLQCRPNGRGLLQGPDSVDFNDGPVTVRWPGETRTYPGTLRVSGQDGRLLILNTVPVADYVAGVVASELDHDARHPALAKALAVAALSYALERRGAHTGYDLCDYTHCQLYQGKVRGPWDNCVQDGGGLHRLVNGGPFLFSRCCGGLQENALSLWQGKPGPAPQACRRNGRDLCAQDPLYQWSNTLDNQALTRACALACDETGQTTLVDLTPKRITAAGRVESFKARLRRADGSTLERNIPTMELLSHYGKLAGWRHLPSPWFHLERQDNRWIAQGRGAGHGCGLCTAGGAQLSRLGMSWREILSFYYPKSRIVTVE